MSSTHASPIYLGKHTNYMQINYKASRTAAKFHASDKVVRGFMGPVGNGKSVANIMEMVRLSYLQWPNSEGVRKTRWLVIRNTYPELKTTTLNTWMQWVPPEIAPVVMSPIITSTLRQKIKEDGTSIEMEVIFMPCDKPQDVKKLLSLEVTGIFINEAREIPYEVVTGARERIGRYPNNIDGYQDVYDSSGKLTYEGPKELDANGNPCYDDDGNVIYDPCRRKALLMDTNPPDTDHWWYQLAEEGHLKGSADVENDIKETRAIFDFFRGPSPLIVGDDGKYKENPKAENVNYLKGGFKYYRDMIAGNTFDHINIQVLGNYGMIKDGLAVYSAYSDRTHCPSLKKPLMPIKGLPICLGWDFGLTPCCVIGQMTTTGQLLIIKELVSESMDVRRFARDIVKPFLQDKLSDFEIGFSVGDPAGNNRGEGEGKTAIGILNDDFIDNEDGDVIIPLNMGFETQPAPTQDPTKRLDAVNSFLIKMVDGQPGFVLAQRCVVLRKGFMGGYCYKRVAMGGATERYKDKPDKGKYSHPHDGLQYLACGFAGGFVLEHEDEYAILERYNSKSTGYW